MNSIAEYIAHYAKDTPDQLCMADEKVSLSYSKAWNIILAYAGNLRDAGVLPGARILVECTQDGRYLIADMACAMTGAVFVPFYRRADIERVTDIFNETGAAFLISETSYDTDSVPAHSYLPVSMLDDLIAKDESSLTKDAYRVKFAFPGEDQPAEILYTTGTTGKSKGIEMTHGANVALAENISYGVNIQPGNVELIPLPLSHSHGLRCCYANLISGTAVVITDGVTKAAQLLNMMDRYHVTAMDISPSAARIMEKILKDRLKDYRDQMRYVQIGTAALHEKEKDFLKRMFPEANLYNFYGATESGRTCVLDFNHEDRGESCIGRATHNATVKVVDDNGNVIDRPSRQNPGRLIFGGKMNMLGYYGHAELTEQTLKDGYVYTNDIGYTDEEGYVYLIGRRDDIINYGGIKISPDEVENAALRTDMIAECACVPMNDPINGQAPLLYVVPRQGEEFSLRDFEQELTHCLDKERYPRKTVMIDKLPKSENGKILRRELMQLS